MKNIFMFSLFIVLFSCNQGNNKAKKETSATKKTPVIIENTDVFIEKFKEVSVTELNSKLSQSNTHFSPKDIMKMYYPQEIESVEGNEKITISEKVLINGNVEVELIHDNLLDDAIKGEKHQMELEKQHGKWTVVSLKKNWKCWRGHKEWGIELCD